MFQEPIKYFAENLDSLRNFLALADAFLNKHEKDLEENKIFALTPVVLALTQLNPKFGDKMKYNEEELKDRYQGKFRLSEVTEKDKDTKSITIELPDEEGEELLRTLKEFNTAARSRPLLYESSLMALISSVEWYISRLIQLYYGKFPNSLGSKDKFFSLEDLKSFDSLKDAEAFLIDSKVEDLMRKSFSDWIKFLRENLGLSMGYLKDTEKYLVETFQRRHLIVHNGGIVNSIYLSRVDPGITTDVKVNDKISVDIKYLKEKISLFELNCLLIGFEMWKKQDDSDKQRAKIALGIIRSHVRDERWEIGEGISIFLKNDKKMSERDLVLARLYNWFCVKQQGRWDEVRQEAESVDFSAKGKSLQIMHLAILDKNDLVFDLLENAIKGGEISCESLNRNQIFASIRADTRFKPIVEKYEATF